MFTALEEHPHRRRESAAENRKSRLKTAVLWDTGDRPPDRHLIDQTPLQ
jgi:hypothetical protein